MQMNILQKGLSYVPTPQKTSISNIMTDFDDFADRMRTRLYYYTSKAKRNPNPFRVSRAQKGVLSASAALEDYIVATKIALGNEVQTWTTLNETTNLTREEYRALGELKKNKDIVIKKADKGSSLVIMDRDNYVREGVRQLTMADHYKPCDSEKFTQSIIDIDKHLKHMHKLGEISKDTYEFLTPKLNIDVRIPHMYHLPKLHKPRKNDADIPGRAIISGNSSPTERVSSFLDYFLKPITIKQSTYLQDTKHLINIIESMEVPEDAYLVAGDIESMYTNIEHDGALKIMRGVFKDTEALEYQIKRPSTDSMCKLLELIMRNNVFMFDDKTYIQTVGLPMGNVSSCNLSDIIVHHFELELIQTFKRGNKLLCFLRFRDDIFIIWNGTLKELKLFMKQANAMHKRFRFTFDFSLNMVIFLDLEIFKGFRFRMCNKLDMKTHFKPTNTFQYLERTSCHPDHVFEALVKGELTRYARNCNNSEDFVEQRGLLKERLAARGYSKVVFEKASKGVKHNRRHKTLEKKIKKKANTRPVFVTEYEPKKEGLGRLLSKHWHIITECKEINQAFPDKPMMAFKRHDSIGNTVVRAALASLTEEV